MLLPPFRSRSLYYVAFFGGAVACTVVAMEQAARLRVPKKRLVLGLIGLSAVLVPALVVLVGTGESLDPGNRLVRWWFRGFGLGACWLQLRELGAAEEAYQMSVEVPAGDEIRSSLWGWGLMAVVIGGLIQMVLVAAMLWPVLPFTSQ